MGQTGLALGAVADVFAKRLGQKYDEQKKEEQDRFGLITKMVQSGLSSGAIEDPNQAISFLLQNAPGKSGKGGKGGELPGGIKTLLGAITKAGGASQQPQMQGQMPKFRTQQEVQSQQQASELEQLRKQQDIQTEGSVARTTADLEARKSLADRWIAQGIPEEQAYAMAKLDKPPTPRNIPGTVSGKDLPDGTLDVNGQTVDPAKSYRTTQVGGKFEYSPTEVKDSGVRSHMTGEALQAYDMNQMVAGIDPETGKAPENPEDVARLKAAGQEMKKARDLKNKAVVVRINTGSEKESDRQDSGRMLADGLEDVMQISGREARQGAIAEANKIRAARGQGPLDVAGLHRQYVASQRVMDSFTSGPDSKTLQSLDQGTRHLDTLYDKALALQNSNTPLYNSIRNYGLTKAAGAPEVKGFLTAADASATELAKFLKGTGAPTTAEIGSFKSNLAAAQTPAELASVIGTFAHLAQGGLDALRDKLVSGMDNPEAVKQFPQFAAAQKTLSKLQMLERQFRGMASAPPGGHASSPAKGGSAGQVTTPSGTQYSIQVLP